MRQSRHFIILLAILSVAGCVEHTPDAPTPPPIQPPAQPPAEEPPAEPVPPVPPPKPPVPPKPQGKQPVALPTELIGLDRDGVVKLLGEPADDRTEGNAHLFTYRGKNCQLDVMFFLDIKSGAERVLSYEQQPETGKRATACYTALRGGGR